MDKIEYLYQILVSMRYDFSSKWKLFLEKYIALYICKRIIEDCENDNDDWWYFTKVYDDIKKFKLNDDGRYFSDIYSGIYIKYLEESDKQ